MKNFLFMYLTVFFIFIKTIYGQKIFKKKYPVEQINKLTNASLLVSNTLNEDIILTLRELQGTTKRMFM